jgi:hypothetical protein
MTNIFEKDAVKIFCKILRDAGLTNVDKNDVEYFVQSLIHASTTETNDIMLGSMRVSHMIKNTDDVE